MAVSAYDVANFFIDITDKTDLGDNITNMNDSQKPIGRTIAFDFDGVIATYSGTGFATLTILNRQLK